MLNSVQTYCLFVLSFFSYPWLLLLLLATPALSLLTWWARRRREKMLIRFGNLFALQSAAGSRGGLRALKNSCFSLGVLLLIIGIAGPRWGQNWEYEAAGGRDIVVALDLSRSMLAEGPSRQQRAKQMLADLSEWTEKRGGYRLALVVFAGHAKVACPLTHDYDHFRFMLQEFDAADLPPELRPTPDGQTSGTRIGAALQQALKLHDPVYEGSQDIILVSDGDDPLSDREWRQGIDAAKRRKIAIDVVGVGDPNEMKWIPWQSEFLQFAGKPVQTKLREDPLQEIAGKTGGVYVPARTRTLPLGELYPEVLRQRQSQRQATEDRFPIRRARHAWFLWPALVLLTLALVFPAASRKRK